MTSRDAVFIYGRLDAISVFQGWKSPLVGVIFLCFAFAKSVSARGCQVLAVQIALNCPAFVAQSQAFAWRAR